jgi:sugar lactone lactonase YvrE
MSAMLESSGAARRVIKVGARPQSVTRGFGGEYFVTVMNGTADADGAVKRVDGDAVRDFATELDEPQGICFTGKLLLVADVKRIWRLDAHGGKSLLVDEDDFPQPPRHLTDLACDPGGKIIYAADPGEPGKPGRIYRIGPRQKVTVALEDDAALPSPNGLALVSGRLLVADFSAGTVFEVRGKALKPLAAGLPGASSVTQDSRGNLYVASWDQGKVWRLPRPSSRPAAPTVIAEGFQSAGDFFLDPRAHLLLVPDTKAGTLTLVPLA